MYIVKKISNYVIKFLRAIELEADSESMYYQAFNITGSSRRIPRVLLIINYIKHSRRVTDFAVPAFVFIFCVFIGPLYFLYKMVHCMIKAVKYEHTDVSILNRCKIYLASSSATNLDFLPKGTKIPSLILTIPFKGVVEKETLPKAKRVDLLELASFLDLLTALFLSVATSYCVLFSEQRKCALWVYTSFQWFLTLIIVNKLNPCEIWVSNHHDRWLQLALSVSNSSVTLVQHGRLYHTLPNGEVLSYSRLKKLDGVATIYALDAESEALFCDFINCETVVFFRLTPSLKICPWRQEGNNRLKILVIGGSFKLDFYIGLMDEIYSAFFPPPDLAIRHHPLQKIRLSDLRQPVDYWELTSADPVPEPDLIVTYGSSIDDQLTCATQAKSITYVWSEQIDLPEIVQRVRSAAINLASS